jgi:formylglycine-generating enzyme required for sulfatase activity
LKPAYRSSRSCSIRASLEQARWIDFPGGIYQIGHEGSGFGWDNERPRHKVLIHPFRLADRLVTNWEWLEFIAGGGYETATLWLSDG